MRKGYVFIDGENILTRFESEKDMKKLKGDEVEYVPDRFVWSPRLTMGLPFFPIRAYFYSTFSGSYDDLEEWKTELSRKKFYREWENDSLLTGDLVPKIFKKEKRSQKNKSVDINIAIDSLRLSYANKGEIFYFLSGDGDFIPLYEEIMRTGNEVWVAGFKSGLGKGIEGVVDSFFPLDVFFYGEGSY